MALMKSKGTSIKDMEPLLMINANPGVDDCQAIMMALCHPYWKTLGIFIHYGNHDRQTATENCVKFLDLIGKTDVPVFQCSERPLVYAEDELLHRYHPSFIDHDYLPDCYETVVQEEHGILAMIRLAKRYKRVVTLINLGPLTDLAMAHRIDPKFSDNLLDCFILGGCDKGNGNATKNAETNFYTDPEAAHVVFKEFLCPITLFTLDLCEKHLIPFEFWTRLHDDLTKYSKAMFEIEDFNVVQRWKKRGHFILYDEIVMAALLCELCITYHERATIEIELRGALTRGQMIVEWESRTSTKNVRVVKTINIERVKAMMLGTHRYGNPLY